jgi:hypothetical protein
VGNYVSNFFGDSFYSVPKIFGNFIRDEFKKLFQLCFGKGEGGKRIKGERKRNDLGSDKLLHKSHFKLLTQ